jgi:hypothetical protein
MGIDIQGTAAEPVAAEQVSATQGQIPFLLRIGVTGHRNLTEDEALFKAVKQALELAISASGYVKGEGHTPLALTAVSALAEGADRLVAKQVLDEWNGSKPGLCTPCCRERSRGLPCRLRVGWVEGGL